MDLPAAVERVLLGESLPQLAGALRAELITGLGLELEDAPPDLGRDQVEQFMRRLCRELGERHDYDPRVATVLAQWAHRVDDYEAFDALLANFRQFDGRETLVRRGRALFPGPLTAHWDHE